MYHVYTIIIIIIISISISIIIIIIIIIVAWCRVTYFVLFGVIYVHLFGSSAIWGRAAANKSKHSYWLCWGGAECLYELLVVFGPQFLLDMWLPRSIGCSRGCAMSSCNHACESLLAWMSWCGFFRRVFFRRGLLLGVDFLVWIL